MSGGAPIAGLAAYGCAPDRDTIELLRALVLGEPLTEAARALVWVACAEGVDRGLVRLLPLLHRHPAAADLDPAIRRRVEHEHRLAGLRFIAVERTARRLVETLRPAGIVPMFLKGFPLASRVYASPALRPMGDLDLAVGPGQLESACVLVRELGFEEKLERSLALGPGRHAVTFKRAADAQIVDLHQFVLVCSRWPGADERFWARAEPLPVGGAQALTLAPEDHVLHGCLHGYGFHPLYTPFRWMVDVCTLLARPGFRWEILLAEAERQRCEGVLAATLGFLDRHLDAPVPAEALARLASAPRRPVDDAYFRLHGRLDSTLATTQRVRALWASFRRQENLTRAGPLTVIRWVGRRWQRGSILETFLEGLRRLPLPATARSKHRQGAGVAARTRRLRTLAARRRP